MDITLYINNYLRDTNTTETFYNLSITFIYLFASP